MIERWAEWFWTRVSARRQYRLTHCAVCGNGLPPEPVMFGRLRCCSEECSVDAWVSATA